MRFLLSMIIKSLWYILPKFIPFVGFCDRCNTLFVIGFKKVIIPFICESYNFFQNDSLYLTFLLFLIKNVDCVSSFLSFFYGLTINFIYHNVNGWAYD